MAESGLVHAGFLIALLGRRDGHHGWAKAQIERRPPPWAACDAVLAEAFHRLGPRGWPALSALLRRGAVAPALDLAAELDRVLALMGKHIDVPMSLADACLARMTERLPDPVGLSTDADLAICRRHGRQVVPRLAKP